MKKGAGDSEVSVTEPIIIARDLPTVPVHPYRPLNAPTKSVRKPDEGRSTSSPNQVNLPSVIAYLPASQTRPSTLPPLSTMNTSTANTW